MRKLKCLCMLLLVIVYIFPACSKDKSAISYITADSTLNSAISFEQKTHNTGNTTNNGAL